ncbi:MAG: DNA-binding protein WhiA [Eubacteriales bacterium]|nr:DNA-binding protein WhiA [Eubacteriales bacterium]
MSFSSECKLALIREEESKDCCKLAELASFMFGCGALLFEGKGRFAVKLSFEYAALARRAFTHIRQMFSTTPVIKRVRHERFGGKYQYSLHIGSANASPLLVALKMVDYDGNLISMLPQYVPQKTCCKRAFVRAAFLVCGSVQDPVSGYHLELVSQSEQFLKILKRICKSFGVECRQSLRRESSLLYIKKADDISDFLAIIGADQAVMHLEDTIIKKQVLNSINRALNCDTSNINKTLVAAQKQLEDIALLQQHDALPESLQTFAALRIENPELSLEQLGQMLVPPLSKSGVNHKMRKISALAKQYISE